MESQQNNRSDSGVLRSTAMGAAVLAVVTAPGTCFYLYQWVATGNLLRLSEAISLLLAASFMGGLGGAAYHLVLHSRLKSPWKPFVAVGAAMEAYLLGGSFLIVVSGLAAPVAPHLNQGLPVSQLRFWLMLHGYGVLLCVVAWGFVCVPRVVQILIGVVALVLVLLTGIVMLVLLTISPAHLDLWFSFLKPLSVAYQLLLVVLGLVSIVGWVRYLRGKCDVK